MCSLGLVSRTLACLNSDTLYVDKSGIADQAFGCMVSLDGSICSIGTGEVHLSKLSLYLVDFTTQILNIAGKSRHFIELAPLVRVCNHL
jgi:hypothetical protein